MTKLEVLSQVLGYVYTVLWSVSNYPQFFSNYRRQSVNGFSVTFQTWNMIGFTCYLLYCYIGFFYQKHLHITRSIEIQDLIYAGHSWFLVLAIGVQVFVLYPKTITGDVHMIHRFLMVLVVGLGFYNIGLGAGGFLPWYSRDEGPYAFSVVQYLGFAKSFISFIKYVPQCILNYQNKHTMGYNIYNVMLDLGGGLCSFAQMFVNCYAFPNDNGKPDFEHITSNMPKLILGLESATFCIIFLVQHFIIYRSNNEIIRLNERQKDETLDALLGDEAILSDHGMTPSINAVNRSTV